MIRCADEEFINNAESQIFLKKSIKKKIWTYFHSKSYKETSKKQEKISDNKMNWIMQTECQQSILSIQFQKLYDNHIC